MAKCYCCEVCGAIVKSRRKPNWIINIVARQTVREPRHTEYAEWLESVSKPIANGDVCVKCLKERLPEIFGDIENKLITENMEHYGADVEG